MLPNHFKKVCKLGELIVLLICNAVFSLSITHGPYLVDQKETTVTVLWFTDANSIGSIEYGTGGSFSLTADDATRGIMNVGTRHEARITGLSAGTTYNYRVTATGVTSYAIYFPVLGSTVKSANSELTTFDTDKASFTFYFLTDIHNSGSQFTTLLNLADWDNVDFLVLPANTDPFLFLHEHADLFEYVSCIRRPMRHLVGIEVVEYNFDIYRRK